MDGRTYKRVTINGVVYKLLPPDGGWGYVVALATIIVYCFTIIPMNAFGLIYGGFLKTIGDETTGTTLSNGMFNTVQSFTGLIANGVLNSYSYRKVSVAGTIIFFFGTIGVVFSQNLIQFITFYGVIEGVGFGLIMPAVLSAFNSYFVEKMAVMMSIAMGVMIAASMAYSQVAAWSMEAFGFRGTAVGLAGLSLLCVPTMLTLQPVKWHMKKVPVEDEDVNDAALSIDHTLQDKKYAPLGVLKSQTDPLLHLEKRLSLSQTSINHRSMHSKPRRSIISLGDRFASITTINNLSDGDKDEDNLQKEKLSIWQSFIKSMDMSLLKDSRYLNVSVGLSLCFTADMAFVSIMALLLESSGIQPQQIALIITVFFGSDLVARTLLTVISGIFKIRSRMLVLFSALFSAIFRTVLVLNDTYVWKMCILAILGFLRCFIQTPLPLVISEEYPDRFSTAFSLFMVVNGIISLTNGLLMSFIKSYTHSDVMVCHSLTVAFSICVISWITEMTLCRRRSGNEQKK